MAVAFVGIVDASSALCGRYSAFRQVRRYFTTMADKADEIFIQGLTLAGKPFRPSDWAERLCGVMTCFRPGNARDAHLYYSSYVRPIVIDQVKCVVVSRELEQIEPAAYRFLLGFAEDNELQVVQACALPDPPATTGKQP